MLINPFQAVVEENGASNASPPGRIFSVSVPPLTHLPAKTTPTKSISALIKRPLTKPEFSNLYTEVKSARHCKRLDKSAMREIERGFARWRWRPRRREPRRRRRRERRRRSKLDLARRRRRGCCRRGRRSDDMEC